MLLKVNLNLIWATESTTVGRDSSIGTATRYGLHGLGIESWWSRDFPHPSRPALWPTQPPVQWILSLFPGGKMAGTWRQSPTSPSAEVKERLELQLYYPSGPSGPLIGQPLPLPFFICVIRDGRLVLRHYAQNSELN
jgi:hypothetical protein